MKFYCDNNSTISIAHNQILHQKLIKPAEVDHHFIVKKLNSGSGRPPQEILQNTIDQHTYKETHSSTISIYNKQAQNEEHLLTSLRGSVEV